MVLLLGGTGRTGRSALRQLLDRGASVRAVVRSRGRIPADLSGKPGLALLEADLMSMGEADLLGQVRGCDAIVSCLGHTPSFRGIYGSPRDLVTQTAVRLRRAIAASQPSQPVKLILMSSVSVNHPGGSDTRRGAFEKALVWALRGVLPPAMDNQRAADFLYGEVGTSSPFVEWVAVRPDTLVEGEVSSYDVHDTLVNSLLAPGKTNIANVAHFMCELVMDDSTWEAWRGKLPVVVNAERLAASQPEA
jgi:nucleoside-diphosphate-sugar epimerase